MEIEVKNGKYFEYGDRYFVEFKYGSKEQQDKMFEVFEKGLIPSYGSHSSRSQQGKDYIMPYLADEQGKMTTENTGKIGGTSIPEDLLPEFIRRFVEVDGATVKVGNEVIKGTFDYDQFNEMVSKLGLQVELKKDQYFEYGDRYFVEFKYGSKEQQDKMFEVFEKGLIPSYGSHSSRSQQGKDYIMPYLADEQGKMTTENTGKIGGTSIPEDLLPEFIRRFVEVDGATVTVGDEVIKGTFDYDQFNEIVASMGNHKTR